MKASGNRIPQAISFRGTGGHILRGKWAFKRGIVEYFEVHWANNSYAERICYPTLKAKEAWEKFVFKLGMWPLYRIWFVSINQNSSSTLSLPLVLTKSEQNASNQGNTLSNDLQVETIAPSA